MNNADNTQYCSDLARRWHADLFLSSLFVPAETRHDLHAVYAFSAEIAGIRQAVSEELLAHIRYAWWEESLALFSEGHSPRAHPVLESLAPLAGAGRIATDALGGIITLHRSHYPEAPQTADAPLYALSETLLSADPEGLGGFRRATKVIQKHRQAYGRGKNGWLHLKLLAAGMR